MIYYLNLISDLNLSRQGFLQPKFYGNLVYKFKNIVGSNYFSVQIIKIISHYTKICYNINVFQQTKVGRMPAKKHICHVSGIYWGILANNGKNW